MLSYYVLDFNEKTLPQALMMDYNLEKLFHQSHILTQLFKSETKVIVPVRVMRYKTN